MSALANQRFLKMNGLGNEIVILDLRGTRARVSEEDARAIAADPRSRFDQLMAIHDPRAPGTDAYLRIYNTDGSESGACGNGTRCVAWAMLDDPMMARPAGPNLLLETRAGLLPVTRVAENAFTVDMGAPRLRWDEIPLRDPFQDLLESRMTVALFGWEVGAADERLEIGRQPNAHRPAAMSGGGLDEGHVNSVHVRPFLAVDLHVDEFAIQDFRRRVILERFVRHDVTPVAGRITD